MFGNLKAFIERGDKLEVDASGQPTEHEDHVAVLAVLLEMAHSSPGFTSLELNSIVDSLYRAFKLRAEECGNLLQIVEFLKREKKRSKEFIEILNTTFNDAQREHIVMLVWKVLLADRVVDKSEIDLAALLRKQLKVSLEAAVRAQKQAHEECSRQFAASADSDS